MKKYIVGVLFALSIAAPIAVASPANPQQGVDYQLLPGAKPLRSNLNTVHAPPVTAPNLQKQPVSVVEVKEFFWYGCPHCADLDAQLAIWLENHHSLVRVWRIPVAFSKDLESHQRLYHALVAMNIPAANITALNKKIFKEIQVNKNYLLTPDVQAQFLAKHGVDLAKFLQAYSSTAVNDAVAQDRMLSEKYQIDGVPVLIIDNQYLTSPAMTGSMEGTVRVLEFLVHQIRSSK